MIAEKPLKCLPVLEGDPEGGDPLRLPSAPARPITDVPKMTLVSPHRRRPLALKHKWRPDMTTSELIAKLERKLAVARRVPTHRREAECADVIEDTCRAMLDDLYSGRDRERPWPLAAAP